MPETYPEAATPFNTCPTRENHKPFPRMKFPLLPALIALASLAGCATGPTPWQPHKNAIFSYLGNAAQGAPTDPAPTHADVSYGDHERHRFDFWQAQGEGPRPLFLYFHGGGFGFGNKWELRPSVLRSILNQGISVISCNYRLVESGPLPQPLHDGARALQHIRHHSADFNIDPNRIACGGYSAGGLISLWLAFHDDLADPDSPDPIARQSTRITCAAVSDAPTLLVAPEVYGWFQVPRLREFPSTRRCFEIKSLEELHDPRVVDLARQVSPYTHVSPGDPPVYLAHTGRNRSVNRFTLPTIWIHHPLFGIKLRQRIHDAGNQCTLHYRNGPPPAQGPITFLTQHLTP